MTKLEKVLAELPSEHREYFKDYFKNASQELMNSFCVLEMQANTIFIEEGGKADSVYILLKGKVNAVDYRVLENIYKHFEFYPIEVFGAMEIIGELDYYTATLVTVENSVLVKTTRMQFDKFLKENFDVFRKQAAIIQNYLLRQTRKERLNVLLSGNDRMALLLTQMYKRIAGKTHPEISIERKEFGDTTGLSERTVTRILKSFEEKELISRKGWDIRINYEQYLKLKEILEKVEVIE